MAQKVRYFEFELVKEIIIKKVDVTDFGFPFSVNSKNEIFIYSRKGKSLLSSNGQVIKIAYLDDSIRKQFYPKVTNFSFINDSLVFIIYHANEHVWNEDANVIYNLHTKKIMNELNFEHLGFINNVEMPLSEYGKFNSSYYNFSMELYPFDHYYSYHSSFILTYSGSNAPFDSVYPTKKGTIVKLKQKPKTSYSYPLNLESLDSNFQNYKFDNGMAEFWNFVPKKCKFDEHRILLSYPTLSDLVILNLSNSKVERRKFNIGNINITGNSISNRYNKFLHDSINFGVIQYNSELNYIIRNIYIPPCRSASGKSVYLQVISDTFGNIIGIKNRANRHTTIVFYKNNLHFGMIISTDSTERYGMFKIKWLDSFYDANNGFVTYKNLTSRYSEL